MAVLSNDKPARLQFGLFEADFSSRELRKRGRLIKLEPLPFQMLQALVERPGQIVTREELRGRLWPKDTHVEFEDGLNTAVRKLRHALSDSAESPVFIETLSRRGYRFIAPVSAVQPEDMGQIAHTSNTSGQQTNAEPQSIESPQVAQRYWIVSARYSWILVAEIAVLCVLVGANIAVHFIRARRTERPNSQASEIQKLTESGDVDSAAISPDGRLVVYSRREGELWSLRVKQVEAGGDAQILAPDTHALVALAFSPDSNHIYFGRADESLPDYKRLYVMPALGGATQLVATNVDGPPGFSPDGRQFVFMRGVPEKNLIELRIANSDGSGEHLLATIPESSCDAQHGATWSPDGRTIAVGIKHQGSKFDSTLYAIKSADGSVKPIYASDGSIGRPSWLPEGHDLLVSIADAAIGRGQLWFVSYPLGDLRRLTNDLSDYDLTVDLTRDGKTAVAVEKTVRSKLWIAENRLLTNLNPAEDLTEPLLEALETRKGTIVIRGPRDVWLVDGRRNYRSLFLRQAVDNLAICDKYIVVNTIQDGTRQLLRYDEDGGAPKSLVRDNLSFPRCSADGRFVFYSSQSYPQRIMRVSIDGGPPKEIAKVPGQDIMGPLDISHDGRWVVFAFGASDLELRFGIVQSDGGPLIKSLEPVTEANLTASVGLSPIRWSPDDSAIQYIGLHNGTSNVWEQPVSRRPARRVTSFDKGQVFSFNWSRNGKRLLIDQGSVTSDLVLLSNLR